LKNRSERSVCERDQKFPNPTKGKFGFVTMNATAPVHVVLRIPLITRINGRSFNTVEAHNQVTRSIGRVAFAKFGNPGSRARCERIKEQIDNQVETFLILVAKQGERYLGFQSRLSSVHYGKPSPEILSIAPNYYREQESPGLWFITSTPFMSCDLRAFCLSTNGRPLLDVIRECRTASMLVDKSA
jgi:hypothetical protein